MNKSKLQYIKRDRINSKKWAECIETADNSRFYANEWHLDRTSENWGAIIYGDYQFVMPLPLKRKLGIPYVYQPLFSQQLGIFPNPPANISIRFYKYLFAKFRYVDTQLNASNAEADIKNKIEFKARQNFLLPLNHNYQLCVKGYAKNTKRNLAKANKSNLNFISGISLEKYLNFKLKNLPGNVKEKDVKNLKGIIALGQYKSYGEIFGVFSPENELCAAVYFCRWKERIIFMNAASSPKGKKLGAMYFLTDKFIEMNSGKNLILDFEGSMIPGVARFYKGFGAEAESYFQLRYNRLPLPVKWLKR